VAYSDDRARGGIKALNSSKWSPDPDWEPAARAFHNFTWAFVLFAAPYATVRPIAAISNHWHCSA
jgi:hypothetical protein